MSDTPETDATANPLWGEAQEVCLLRELARKLERERDEARAEAARLRSMSHVEMMSENLNVYDHTVEWENRCLKAERERDEAREDAKRATYDAAQETIKVSTVKSHWIEACRREEKLRTALQRLADCDWVITLPDRMDAVRKIAREALQ